MRTSFHHQPEAQHPNFQLSTSWQADYPIFRGQSGHGLSDGVRSAAPRLLAFPAELSKPFVVKITLIPYARAVGLLTDLRIAPNYS